MRFSVRPGFTHAGFHFISICKDSFDTLYEEGAYNLPKMLTIGLPHYRTQDASKR
jgi:hypothetical protein